jgi:uncharacterized membrane protein YjjP (DUF1212 family)
MADPEQDQATSLELISSAAQILFSSGQTTERMIRATHQFSSALGVGASVVPSWGELTICSQDHAGAHVKRTAVKPSGVDMKKVIETLTLIDRFREGLLDTTAARTELEKISRANPVPILSFSIMAGAGAAALGVIFGEGRFLNLILIALSACVGAVLRRSLARISPNLYVQPFCAALFAGIIGAVVERLHPGSALCLVAVCPCMILVPGPHFLNGALDLARARFILGTARIAYACLITSVICAGLVLGLLLGGTGLPASSMFQSVPLVYDVVAAGVAVAAYGTFFTMPWRILVLPILVGMLAHASRWIVITMQGATAETGALAACLLVGIIMTPVAEWLRLPFAGAAFACVVSLIPGVFVFQMVGGLTDLVTTGFAKGLLPQVINDSVTAVFIMLAMAVGLLVPKLCFEHLWRTQWFDK